MNRGDIVRVDLPPPQGVQGHEQIGERPAMIVQCDAAIQNLSTVLVIPFTRNRDALRFFGSVAVPATQANGLQCDSVALIYQLRVIDKNRIRRVDGQIEDDILRQIEVAVSTLLGV